MREGAVQQLYSEFTGGQLYKMSRHAGVAVQLHSAADYGKHAFSVLGVGAAL